MFTDILSRASALNLDRLATLGLHHGAGAGSSPDLTSHPSGRSIFTCHHGQNSDAIDTNTTHGHYIAVS